MTLAELRDALKKHLEKYDSVRTKAAASGSTEEDIVALENFNAETKRLNRLITAAEEAEKDIGNAAQPIVPAEQRSAPARVLEKLSNEAKIGLSIKAMIEAHKHHQPMAKMLEDNGYGAVVKELVTVTPSAGGVTIPENLSQEMITLLRPNSAFIQGDPRRLLLPNGNLTMPRQETGVSGGYIAEATDIPVEEPTLGEMSFSSKKLAVIVPISNELLTWSTQDMEAFVRGDISLGLGGKMDLALLRGDGAGGSPVGITRTPGISTFVSAVDPDAAVSAQIQRIESELARAEVQMMLANLPEVRRVWIMSPRTITYLSSLRDGNGNYVYPTLNNETPTLRRKRVLVTTQFPINMGAETDETEIALVEFSEVFFAQPPGGDISFAVSNEAMYKVGGVAYSAFQRDVTLIRGIMHHDTDIRRLSAVVKITGVKF